MDRGSGDLDMEDDEVRQALAAAAAASSRGGARGGSRRPSRDSVGSRPRANSSFGAGSDAGNGSDDSGSVCGGASSWKSDGFMSHAAGSGGRSRASSSISAGGTPPVGFGSSPGVSSTALPKVKRETHAQLQERANTLQRLLEEMHATLGEHEAKLVAYKATNAHLNGRNVELRAELAAIAASGLAARVVADFVRAWSAMDRVALETLLVEACPLRTNGRWWLHPSSAASADVGADVDADDLLGVGSAGDRSGAGDVGGATSSPAAAAQRYTSARPWLESLFSAELAMHWEPTLHFASSGSWALIEFALRGASSERASTGGEAPQWIGAVSEMTGGAVIAERVRHMALLLRIDAADGGRVCEMRQLVANPGFDLRSMALEQMRSMEGTLAPTSAQMALRARWEAETLAKEHKAAADEKLRAAREEDMTARPNPRRCAVDGGGDRDESASDDDEFLIRRPNGQRRSSSSGGAGEVLKSVLGSAANALARRRGAKAEESRQSDVAE